MQIPISWLREFCNPDINDEQLAQVLTMGGFEVEDMRSVAPVFDAVVVGELKEVEPHPDADRLRVCRVDVGQSDYLQIVCGAPNARVGLRAPVALVGASLPTPNPDAPFKIKLSKLRGVESHGMLCSAKELGIDDDASGLLELEADAPVGKNVRDYLLLDDTILTLKLTPNLGHALSVYGIARELAALTGAPLHPIRIKTAAVTSQERLKVIVEDPLLCGRFSGRVVSGIQITGGTPVWMRERLKRCGQRSVSPLVDISNYVMFEIGQPTHIFDRDAVVGGLRVNWAQAGESLELLNGSTVTLEVDVGVIRDDKAVESLAGIMGGQATAVNDATNNIFIEAAFWWPQSIAGKARRYHFSTEAAHRFERGVDPQLCTNAVERVTQLVQEICGGQAGPLDDVVLNVPEEGEQSLRVARASKVIGMPLTVEQCQEVFQRLGWGTRVQEQTLSVTVPSYRFDIKLEEDLIEEVARLIGYEQLPTVPPLAPIVPRLRPEGRRSTHRLRHQLADLGYLETINYSFVPQAWEQELSTQAESIALLNPIASHMNVMRSSLLGSLLQVLKFNIDRRNAFVRIFEIGRVFLRDEAVATSYTSVKGVKQPLRVAALAYSDPEGQTWHRKTKRADFFEVKGDIEALIGGAGKSLPALGIRFEACTQAPHPALHPGRSAYIFLGEQNVGCVGDLHPLHQQKWDLAHAPVVFEIDLDALVQRPLPQPQPLSKFQSAQRDVAVLVSENVSFQQLQDACLRASHQGLLQKVEVFDVFRPQAMKVEASSPAELRNESDLGVKSVALRLTMTDFEKNLTDSDMDAVVSAVFSQLSMQLDAQPRT